MGWHSPSLGRGIVTGQEGGATLQAECLCSWSKPFLTLANLGPTPLRAQSVQDSSAGQESAETVPVSSLGGKWVLDIPLSPPKKPTVTLVSVPGANRTAWPLQSGLILSGHREAGMRWGRGP